MKARYISHSEVDRTAYDALVRASAQGMFYHLSGYLDIVAPGWHLIELRDEQGLAAGMPLCPQKKRGFWISHQPRFSQYLGPVLRPDLEDGPEWHRLSQQGKALKVMLEALPRSLRWISHGISHKLHYPLPFHWEGFTLRTRYSYRIHPGETEAIEQFDKDKRYQIRRAEKKGFTVRIPEIAEAAELLPALGRTALSEGRPVTDAAGLEMLPRIAHYLAEQDLGYTLLAEGPAKAVSLVGRMNGQHVYLYSAGEPEALKEGAKTLLLTEAIRRAHSEGCAFDFEGSMVQGIESFIRGFSGVPEPYLHIEKNRLPLLLQWLNMLRS